MDATVVDTMVNLVLEAFGHHGPSGEDRSEQRPPGVDPEATVTSAPAGMAIRMVRPVQLTRLAHFVKFSQLRRMGIHTLA